MGGSRQDHVVHLFNTTRFFRTFFTFTGLETEWFEPENLTPKPSVGDIIQFNRGPYQHVGISDGEDHVYHFGADPEEMQIEVDMKSKAIWRKNKLADVAHGCTVCINNAGDNGSTPFEREEIMKRCEQALGDFANSYNAALNNCEHKANAMRYGSAISKQAVLATAVAGGGILAGCFGDPCSCWRK